MLTIRGECTVNGFEWLDSLTESKQECSSSCGSEALVLLRTVESDLTRSRNVSFSSGLDVALPVDDSLQFLFSNLISPRNLGSCRG